MWIMSKSDIGGKWSADMKLRGFRTYDDAYNAMEEDIEREAEALGVAGDEEEYGANYDTGSGFVGIYNGYEYFLEEVHEE